MSALLILAVLFLMSASAFAKEVAVDCGKKNKSISAELAKLPAQGPHTIWVNGECHEAVVIERRDDLTLVGLDGASIHDPTPEENPVGDTVVSITESSRIQLENLGIYGGYNGVVCGMFSSCRLLNLEVANATGEGIAFSRSRGSIEGSTVVRNNGHGVILWSQSTVLVAGEPGRPSIRDNESFGLRLQDNSVLLLHTTDVTGNGGHGIFADLGAEFRLNNVTVTDNGGSGVWLRSGTGQFNAVTVSGNTGAGVWVGKLSFANFAGAGNTVTGNITGDDIQCASGTATTVQAIQISARSDDSDDSA